MTSRTIKASFLLTLFVAASIGLNAPAHSEDERQKFTIKVRKQNLRSVLNMLEKESGYKIFIDAEKDDRRITMDIEDKTLEEAIKKIMRGYNYLIVWNEKSKTIHILMPSSDDRRPRLSGVRTRFQQSTLTTPE